MTFHFSVVSRVTAFCVGWWLIGTGIDAIGSRSGGSSSWSGESSFVALSYRQQGRLGVGLGCLSMAASVLGLKLNEKKDPPSGDSKHPPF